MASIGRQVADAFIDIHGDLAPFRKELDRAGSLIDNFGRKLKGLGGLNVIEDSFRYGIEFMQNIDRNSVKLGQMVTGVGALGAAITNMLGATAVIGQDIAALSGIGLLAPGFLTGFGIAMGVTVAALKDMKTVLGDLGPAFGRLQDSISSAFWAEAEAPIRSLVNNLMPTLNTQLTNTAKAMGGLFAEFAASLESEATPERVTGMFEKLNAAIDISRAAIRPFTAALVTLGEHGSKYFARFAEGIVEVSNKFNDFIQRSAQNGDLERWTEAAIQGFKDLGSIIGSSVRIIGSIGDAARAAGVGGLSEMRDRLEDAANIMNSPRFQTAMTSFFRGTSAAVDGVIAGIAKLGPAFESAMPTIEASFGNIGKAAERIGGILATIISNPELQAGFQRFTQAIVEGLDRLAPAAEPFAQSLGGLLDLMSKVLVAVAELVSHVIQKLGPAFDRAGDQFARLIGPLGEALGKVVDQLAPVFDAFVTNVLTPVIDMIIADVLPLAVKIAEAFGPVLIIVLEEVGKLINDVVAPAFKYLNEQFDPAKADDLAGALQGVIDVFNFLIDTASSDISLWEWLDSEPVHQFNADVNQALADFWASVQGNVERLNADVNQGLADFWAGVGQHLATFGAEFAAGWNAFWGGLGTGIAEIWNGIVTTISTWLTNIQTAVVDFAMAFGEQWNTFWAGIGTGVQTAWLGITTYLATQYEAIRAGVAAFIEGVRVVWDGFWNGLGTVLQTVWTGIQAVFQGFVSFFQQLWTSFWNSLTPQSQAVLTNIGNFIQTTWNNITTGLTNFGNTVRTGWDTLWNNVRNIAQTVWTNITSTIQNFVNQVRTNIDNFANTVRTNWQNFWNTVGQILQQAWQNISNAVNTGINNARNFIQSGISAIQSAWQSAWNAVTTFLQQAWNNITNAVNTGINNARNFIQSGISAISSVWNSNWQNITNFLSQAWSNITNFINNGINNARNFVQNGMNAIQNAMSNAWNWVVSNAANMMSNLVNSVGNGINQAANWFAQLPGRVAGALGGMFGQLWNVGVQMIQGLISGIQAMAQNVINAASNVVGGAINAAKSLLGIASPSKVFRNFGEMTGQGLAIGVSNTEQLVKRSVEGIAEAAISVLAKSEMFAAGASAAAGLAEGLAANKDKVATALGGVTVDMAAQARMGALPGETVGIPTEAREAVRTALTIAEGAIQVVAPQADAGLVAKKTLDEIIESFVG